MKCFASQKGSAGIRLSPGSRGSFSYAGDFLSRRVLSVQEASLTYRFHAAIFWPSQDMV